MEAWAEFIAFIGQYLVNVLAAVGILVVGWVLAWLIAGLVRKALQRTGLHERIVGGVTGDDEQAQGAPVDRWIGQVVFVVLMLFVLIAMFEALLLQSITAPLSEMLGIILHYAPRVAGAVLLLALAWVVATLLREALSRGFKTLRMDDRLDEIGLDAGTAELSSMISHTVYWLVLLLFLPGVLGTLQLTGLLGPVTNMINEILAYLPNIALALLILVFGWVVARLVQGIVSKLLASAGIDRLATRSHVSDLLGEGFSLSKTLGIVVHLLIFLTVIVAALQALQVEAITAPAQHMLDLLLAAIPALFAAALLLLLAYLAGSLAAGLVEKGLAALGFDRVFSRLGLTEASVPRVGGRTPSQAAGYLVLVAILVIAVMEALALLQFNTVANLIAEVLVFFGQVVVGLVAIGVGLFLAKLAADTIRTSDAAQADTLAWIAQVAIMVLAVAIGLQQMGLAEQVISLAFGLLLGAVAVAAAIAFGLGGRDVAARRLEQWLGEGPTGRSSSRKKRASRSGGSGTTNK